MYVEKEGISIIGLYENNLIQEKSVTGQASFILENIHTKKFKFPIVCEIYTNELDENATNTEIVFKVSSK